MKTSELTGAALDWAVSEAEGCSYADYFEDGIRNRRKWSTNWAQGGSIIEREKIDLYYQHDLQWVAAPQKGVEYMGTTPLIAAMRCYVASKFGDEINIPEELR